MLKILHFIFGRLYFQVKGDIQIKEAKNEDSAYFNNAKKIIDTMKQKQTADVDVASGATYSSKGIIAAVQNALKEAS